MSSNFEIRHNCRALGFLSANILHKEPEEFVGLAYQGKDICV
jgi:hypothetical protein